MSPLAGNFFIFSKKNLQVKKKDVSYIPVDRLYNSNPLKKTGKRIFNTLSSYPRLYLPVCRHYCSGQNEVPGGTPEKARRDYHVL
jgi:hypothetical protein